MGVHAGVDCIGPNCCIHNPSDHPFRDLPMKWSGSRMFRVMNDGTLVWDPDDQAYWELTGYEAVSIQ